VDVPGLQHLIKAAEGMIDFQIFGDLPGTIRSHICDREQPGLWNEVADVAGVLTPHFANPQDSNSQLFHRSLFLSYRFDKHLNSSLPNAPNCIRNLRKPRTMIYALSAAAKPSNEIRL